MISVATLRLLPSMDDYRDGMRPDLRHYLLIIQEKTRCETAPNLYISRMMSLINTFLEKQNMTVTGADKYRGRVKTEVTFDCVV